MKYLNKSSLTVLTRQTRQAVAILAVYVRDIWAVYSYIYLWFIFNFFCLWCLHSGNTNWGGRLSTVDLLIKVGCFAKKVNNIFIINRSWSKLVSTRWSTVLILPFSKDSLLHPENTNCFILKARDGSCLSVLILKQLLTMILRSFLGRGCLN